MPFSVKHDTDALGGTGEGADAVRREKLRSRPACSAARAAAARGSPATTAAAVLGRRVSCRRDVALRSGRLLDEPLHAPLESRQACPRISGSSVSTANSGISPTIERTFSGTCAAVRQVQHVVEEAVLFVPQLDAVARRDCSSLARCRRSARRTCWRRLRRPDPRCASSSAIASMFRQYIAIQLVPSDCSM